MKIGIIGGGVVGLATARSYMEFAEVRVHDVVKERATHSLMEVLECDIIFVCLPSPGQADGTLDTSIIDRFFQLRLGSANVEARVRVKNFVLKSTVPIGTTKGLRECHGLPNLVHSPEFLTARCAVTDAQLPARNIIGDPAAEYTGASPVCVSLRGLYESRFPGVPLHLMTSDESEAVKLIQNTLFAVKVGLFNEANLLCHNLGLDWGTVRAAILADGRIAHAHTTVPGPDGFGFSGSCLPKDLAQFVAHSSKFTTHSIAEAALLKNRSDRESRRDGAK